MLRSVADLMFFDEERDVGDLSKSLDWILSTFRNNTEFKKLMDLMMAYNRYQRGSRKTDDIEKTRQFLALLKCVEQNTN
jgi:hypothetical protein